MGESPGTSVASWRQSQLCVLFSSSLILTKKSKARSWAVRPPCHMAQSCLQQYHITHLPPSPSPTALTDTWSLSSSNYLRLTQWVPLCCRS